MATSWAVLIATAVLLVRAGQMLGAMGMARAKNVASAGLRSLADLCVAVLCFWALGAAIGAQQSNPVFGIRADYLIGWSGIASDWIVILPVVLIATGIIAPAVAERSRLGVPLAMGSLLAGVLVPMVLHWTRRGWLSQLGFADAAGAAAIHLVPAICAATAAIFVGPRDGKYNHDGSSNMIPGHSVLMIVTSVMLTFIGWAPYVLSLTTGAAGELVVANVVVAAAAGGFVSLIVAHVRFGKTDVLLTCSAVLGALVAITAAADSVRTPVAFIIGLVAGIIVPSMTVIIDLRWKIDDPGGVVAVHGVGAVWALVAAGLFSPGSAGDRLKLVAVQGLGIGVIAITSVALASAVLLILKATTGLRAKEADEYDGLDLAEHDVNAHPDFQQTMIKSYHLREA